jgi:cob(I)alamin adenosyltransferase
MLIIFTGNGKGKTTAALGQMFRAVAGGKNKAVMFQFIKSKGYPSGEDRTARLLGNKMKIVKGGIGFVGILGDKHKFSEHVVAAKRTWKMAKSEIKKDKYALFVLDELNNAIGLKLLSLKEVLPFIKKYAKTRNIIITGRGAKKQLLALADIATEMREIKFRYAKARKGVEF